MAESGLASSVQEKVKPLMETVVTAKSKVEEFGKSAARKFDEARIETADALHTAASSLRDKAHQSSDAINHFGESTAAKLDSASRYVRHHDGAGLLSDLRQVVVRNPGTSLLVAALTGCVMGSVFFGKEKPCPPKG